VGAPSAVSCGAPHTCVVTATQGPLGPRERSVIAVSSNGGSSWAIHAEPRYDLDGVACSSATTCVALGVRIGTSGTGKIDAGLRSTDGGRTWRASSFPSEQLFLRDLSCTAPALCVAVGTSDAEVHGVAYRSVNAGLSWAKVALPGNAKGLHTVSCAKSTCIATSTNEQMAVSQDAGKTWIVHPLPATPAIEGGACMTATTCVMVGFRGTVTIPVVETTSNGGASWATQPLPRFTGSLAAVVCLPTYCVAAGDRLVYSGAKAIAKYPAILTN
jgi:photosystem II stability/assembly factor-like uncharacterized protein